MSEIYQPQFCTCAHFSMGFKNPSMVGKKSLQSESHEIDEKQPDSCGKQDGTHNCSGLHLHVDSVQKKKQMKPL